MRCGARTVLFLSPILLATACASGGGSPSSDARVVLVEVRGSASEADAFGSRFLYEAGERGTALVDARLSGGHLADLTDPASEASRELRDAFAGDSYIGAEIGPCESFRRTTTMPGSVDPMTGVRTNDVIGGTDLVCTASLTEIGADGKTRRSVSVEGRTTVTGGDAGGDPGLEAAREAATQAAKKLFGRKR